MLLFKLCRICTKCRISSPQLRLRPSQKNSQSKQATETASMTKEGKNVIMVLNEIAMQQQVCIDWNIVDEDGPPHMRAFTYTLKMGSYEAVGSGNSKKIGQSHRCPKHVSDDS